MGRTTDVLRKGFRAAKCLTSLKLTTSRIKVMRNKRSISAKQMRGEIVQLIKSGQDAHVYITKADALIKQENMVAVYDLLDQYCHAIMSRFPAIELQRNCPADMKEPIASIIYAAPRCIELTELAAIKDAFVSKYGKDFAAAATELRPNCGVNTQVIELLSIRPATGDMKLKLMKDICKEHNVDWTPGEALAGSPAAGTGHIEAKVEPMQSTATLGSIKANAVGVGEAGPSKTTVLQRVKKPGASNKSSIAEAVVSATNASKTSAQEQSSSAEGDVAKGKPSVPGSFIGVMSSAHDSSKVAGFGTDSSKVDDTKLSTFEEEDARRLRERILQSLKGGSFVEPVIEAETNAEDLHKPMDADAQVVMSDSDSDSFVSVEEGRFEDDVESFSHRAAARKESFQDNTTQGFTEADLESPSSSKKFSTSSQQDVYSRTSSKNRGGAMETHEVMLASSNFSNLPSGSSHKGVSFKVNSKETLNAETALEEERAEDSLNRGKLAEAHSVEGLKESTMVIESMDNLLRVSSKKSSNEEEMMEKNSRKDSMNMGKLVEAQSVEELSEDRKIIGKVAEELSVEAVAKESFQRKDSLEDKSAEATTESSVKWKLSERDSLEAAEGLGDESRLHTEGIIEVTPSVAKTEIKLVENHVAECSLDANKVEFEAEEKSRPPASELFKEQFGFEGGLDDEMSSAAGKAACLSNEKLPGRALDNVAEEPFSSLENALETGDDSGSLPAVGKSVEHPVALGTLESGQDFAAAAKAIAAEAARLAILDYAKRLAESGTIPLDLGELSKLGITFEENKGPQLLKTSTIEGSSECAVSEALTHARKGKNYGTDTTRGEKSFKTEITLNHDEIHSSDHLDAEEMSADNEKSKPSVIENALDGDSGSLNLSATTESKTQDMETEIEDINPFATSVAATTDKDLNSPLSEIDNEKASWVDMTQPGQTTKAGNFGQDDHLDIFFQRKTPRLPEEYPMFDEERYSYPKLKPSFMEGRAPYDGSDLKQSSLQENLFLKPLFDTVTEGQSTVLKESSDSLTSPVFDEGDGGPFKSPVFDDGPDYYDDGVDNRMDCPAVTDEKRPLSPLSIKSPAVFDQEPKACFDKMADDEELFSKERKESPSRGQLKWQPKKPISSFEHVGTGNQSTFDASDTSLGVSGNLMSRRSRRQTKVYDDSKHHGDGTTQLTSSSSVLQKQDDEPERKDEVNVREKKTLGRKQVRPDVSSSSARSQQSSDSPKWVTSQADYSFPLEDDWDSTSTKISSTRTTKSPTRLDNRQRVTSEDFYFPENDDLAGISAGTSMSRKTHTSPSRMIRQELMTHSYFGVEDDPVDYKLSYNRPKIPKVYQHDMVEDDHIEESEGKYKPSLQTSDLSKRTSAGSGFDSQLQQRYGQQKLGMRSEYKHSREDEGESSRTRPMSTRLQPKKYLEDEEPHLVSRYKLMTQDYEPSEFGGINKSRIPNLSKLEKDVVEDDEQQRRWQHGMGSKDVGESLRTRPTSNRQQQRKYIEQAEPILVSRYKPIMQDDDPLDYGTSNQTRISKLYQLEEDLGEDEEQLRSKYNHYREDVGESAGTRPMSSRLQPKKYIEEESSYFVPRYTTRIQDDQPLDYQSSNKSRKPKKYQLEKDVIEGGQVRESLQSQADDIGERASASSGSNRRYQQRRQQGKDALESGYVHYEDVTAGGGGNLASQKPSDFEEAQQVKSSSSRLRPSRQQEKRHIEQMESELAVRYNTATDDHLLGCQEEEDEQFMPQTSPQQKQGPQEKDNWPTPSDGCERDSQSKKQNLGSQRQKKLQKDKQQSVSGHWEKESMAEEEAHKMTSLLEVQQEPAQQVSKSSRSPLYSHNKQGSIPEDHLSKSDQQALEQQVGGTNAHKDGRPQEKGVSEQQEKTLAEIKPLARQHQNPTEEGTVGKQQPSQSTSLSLESSISDPIVLATIPPPTKKPSTPPLVKLESSSSAPSPSKPPEVKVPQKPPNLDDLAANFEALRRARKALPHSSVACGMTSLTEVLPLLVRHWLFLRLQEGPCSASRLCMVYLPWVE
ncbi:hypothetical protein GOP47_0015290 [Adiantum capillus-veneris]|uniref:Uncharacterized protein n=1 Tax=Adiantum capillus-veneris TaxID=13818 RepID=A0A9D4UJE8_ADICA|nr:hypothetical protein GOP47_0015290 [Adiantum capillus-veneris]